MENIFKYFTEKFTESGDVNYEKMDRIIDKGMVLTNGGKFDLPNGYLYTLSSVETSAKFLEAISSESVVFTQWTTDNGFSGATSSISTGILNEWGSEYQSNFETKGVYEATNSTSDLSWFSTTYKFVLNYGNDILRQQAAQRQAQTSRILDKGIVIYYSSETDSIVFSSVETFLKYAEAIGLYTTTLNIKYNTFGGGSDVAVPA
jgi:hypothetical protein